MAESKASVPTTKKVKVIAKNPKLSTMVRGVRTISVGYNHAKYKLPEGSEVEVPAGLVSMLKEHKTKRVVPTGDKGSVMGKNFKVEIFNSFEVVEL